MDKVHAYEAKYVDDDFLTGLKRYARTRKYPEFMPLELVALYHR